MNNLIVSNCSWNGTEYGIKIKTDRTEGGVIQNLQYRDLVMSNVNFAITFYDHYDTIGAPSSTINVPPSTPAADAPETVTHTTPFVSNIIISNLTATGIGGNIAGIIWGLPEAVMTNITLYNVNIVAPTKTFCIYDAKGILIINSNLTAPTTSTTNALTLYNADITVTNNAANTNQVTLGGLAVPGTNSLAFFNARAAVVTSNVLGLAGSITAGGSALVFNQSGIQIPNSNITITSASTLTFSGGADVLNSTLSLAPAR